MHHGEAKSDALAGLLGCEERFEDTCDGVGVHPRSSVRNTEQRIRTRMCRRLTLARVVIHGHYAGLEGDHPSIRHGVARVQDEVGDDLFYLCSIAAYDGTSLIEPKVDAPRVAHERTQKAVCRLGDVVEAEFHAFER